MKLSISLTFVLYWAVLAIDCVFLFNGMDEYRSYTKPLIMPVLYVIMALETADTKHRRSKAIISLVMLFSLAGDILLLNTTEKIYFTLGLLCFLLVHILYASFFIKLKNFALKNIKGLIAAIFLALLYQYFVLNLMWQKIRENDFIPQVIIYSLAIIFMFIAAFNTINGKRARKVALRNFIPGALLFILSDSIIAIIKFYPFVNPPKELLASLGCGVMLTYGAAQFLLVSGAVKFIKN